MAKSTYVLILKEAFVARFGDLGMEFVVPFSSRSRSLALKSSKKKSSNDEVFTQMMMISLKLVI